MKKSLMKKLYLSIFTLVFAVVSLGTTTFAWFTVGGTFTVDAFEGDLKAGQGIEVGVSTLADNAPEAYYVSKLPTNALKNIIEAKNVTDSTKTWSFDAVTPVFTSGKITAFNTITSAGTEAAVSGDFKNNGYVGYNLYINADADGLVYFDDLVIAPNGDKQIQWAAGIDYQLNNKTEGTAATTVEAATKLKYDILSSARLAFQTKDAVKIYESAAITSDTGSAGNSVGLCPDYAKTGSTTIGSTYIFAKKYNLDSMSKTKDAAYVTTTLAKKDVKVDASTTINGLAFDNAKSAYSVAVTARTPVCVSVYLWVEGWDAECVNAILAQGLKMSYTLTYEAAERK